MKSKILFCLLQCCIALIGHGQIAGDYRSLGTTTWEKFFLAYDDSNNPIYYPSWERYDGNSWIATFQSPSAADGIITIRYGHEKNLPSNLAVDQVIVEVGATITTSGGLVADGPGEDLVVNGNIDLVEYSHISGNGSLTVNGTMNWYGGTLDLNTSIGTTGLLKVFYTWSELHLGDLNGHTSLTIHGKMEGNAFIYFNNAEIVNHGLINSNNLGFSSNDLSNDVFWNKQGAVFTNTANGTNLAVTIINEGTLQGTGYIHANSGTNSGNISPGLPGETGMLTLSGVLGSSLENSILKIEIKDGSGGHDQILSNEFDITLGGTLNVTEIAQNIPDGDYVIIRHNSFGQIIGQFSSVNLPPNYCVLYNEPEQYGVPGRNVVLRKGSINYYPDLDGDGYGNPNAQPLLFCAPPPGYSKFNVDCDDTDPNVTFPSQYYPDADGDGHGANVLPESFCIQPPGYVSNHDDCDDTDPAYYQVAIWWPDNDGDGYGAFTAAAIVTCVPPAGYVKNNNDCDDNNNAVISFPEICDGIDNDCDGLIDESFDKDFDGFSVCAGDCNDNDPNIYPGSDDFTGPAETVIIPDAYAINPGGKMNTVYIGYLPASSIILTAMATGGNDPYSYSWTTTPTQMTQQIKVSPTIAGVYNYTAVATSVYGCTAEFTKAITAIDIRSDLKKGKVYICHRDLKGKWTTLSVLTGSVADHLTHGDYLGQCITTAAAEAEISTQAQNKLTNSESELITQGIRLFPNPASNYLNIEWSAKTSASTSISIVDIQGKVIKKVQAGLIQQNTINRKTISLDGLAKGVYILELRTGTDIHVSKFVVQ